MQRFEAIYAFYKKKSRFGAQIAFIIDQMPYSWRRSAVQNNYEFYCKRKLSDIEMNEIIANQNVYIQRFIVWYYRDIDYLINEDKKYGIDTPKEFIVECKRRGFVSQQLRLEF